MELPCCVVSSVATSTGGVTGAPVEARVAATACRRRRAAASAATSASSFVSMGGMLRRMLPSPIRLSRIWVWWTQLWTQTANDGPAHSGIEPHRSRPKDRTNPSYSTRDEMRWDGNPRISRPPRSTAPAPLRLSGGRDLPRAAREHQANENSGAATAWLLRRGKNADNPSRAIPRCAAPSGARISQPERRER